MNKIIKNIIISVIIILAVIQSLYIYKSNEILKYKSCSVQNTITSKKSLLDFYKELNCLKEKNIIGANEVNGKWYIKLKIEGSRNNILDELRKLQIYNINDYTINHNNDNNILIVEISDKNEV